MKESILIVEDEFITADDLQLTLEGAGYRVTGVAVSVQEAREMIRRDKPGIVLLDIHLKGKLSGIVLGKELKEERIPFVYLSANSNEEVLEAAKLTEPYGFLIKPYREKDLLIALDIAHYRHEQSLRSKWVREETLQKRLSAILHAPAGLEGKLLDMARVLQSYIPFDYLSLRFNSPYDKRFVATGFLRIGFDEYQEAGIKEIAVMTGVKPEEIKRLLAATLPDKTPGYFNGEAFRELFQSQPVKGFLAKTFQLDSYLVMPLLSADGFIFNLYFYSRKPDAYNDEHLGLISRLQRPLTSIIDSVAPMDKENALSAPWDVSRMTNPKDKTIPAAFDGIIGNSPQLLNVFDQIAQVAPLDTSVLILGESGTGKESIADSIHRLSPRKDKPFIKINCATLPPTLIESELFGHEKGAFTGAVDKRIGKFELADGGTIFLDEIGEMPTELQPKLLRVLQAREIERLGGKQPLKINVRVITATNRNLEKEVSEDRFRLDLYYRLNVFPIQLPPLRERTGDIIPLAVYFAERFSRQINKPFHGISAAMLSELENYEWPGNIRELENVIEQAVILSDGSSGLTLKRTLRNTLNKLPAQPENPDTLFPIRPLDDFKSQQLQREKEYIVSVLRRTNGRIRGKGGAAELLNEKPTTLETRMAKLGINKKDFS
jgi:transcriptional regulator with GAF, ATPase, and Fis domain